MYLVSCRDDLVVPDALGEAAERLGLVVLDRLQRVACVHRGLRSCGESDQCIEPRGERRQDLVLLGLVEDLVEERREGARRDDRAPAPPRRRRRCRRAARSGRRPHRAGPSAPPARRERAHAAPASAMKRTSRGEIRSWTSGSARYAATTAGSREMPVRLQAVADAEVRRQRARAPPACALAAAHADVQRRRGQHQRVDVALPGGRGASSAPATKRAATSPPRLWPSRTSGRRDLGADVVDDAPPGRRSRSSPAASRPRSPGLGAVAALVVADDAPAARVKQAATCA